MPPPLEESRPPYQYGTESRPRIAVLISGRGSNLQAIIDATTSGALNATVAVVISNRAAAAGLARARDAGIETLYLNPRDYADREAYDRAIVEALRAHHVSLVCLAGFMRLVGRPLLEAFPNRILNIHPSLLPAFRGLDAQKQALEHGVRITGATVHLVTADLDAGPILMQAAVPVLPDDTVDTLSARILVEEHRIYPAAVAHVLNGSAVASRQSSLVSHESSVDALVAAIPFSRDQAFRIVELHAGSGELTDRLRAVFPRAHVKIFDDPFDVAALTWWDAMFGADLVIAPFVMPKLTDAKKQYLYKAIADRVSPRGGVVIVDRVDGQASPLLHQLIWLRHAGFAIVDCRWLVDGVAVFSGFRPRAAAASVSPLPAGN
jgi:phosphoribosylglycinamide formyltransferase 1